MGVTHRAVTPTRIQEVALETRERVRVKGQVQMEIKANIKIHFMCFTVCFLTDLCVAFCSFHHLNSCREDFPAHNKASTIYDCDSSYQGLDFHISSHVSLIWTTPCGGSDQTRSDQTLGSFFRNKVLNYQPLDQYQKHLLGINLTSVFKVYVSNFPSSQTSVSRAQFGLFFPLPAGRTSKKIHDLLATGLLPALLRSMIISQSYSAHGY